MARDKSEYKSGINKAARTFTALIEAVEDLGGNDEHIRRIETDPTLRGELAKLIVGQSQNGAGDTYAVTVDYDQSLEQMIAAGRYDWKDGNFTPKHFRIKGEGKVDVEITLVHYNRVSRTEDVLKDLDARGLRPIKIEELLALGAAKPELQRIFPIIALGSVWQGSFGVHHCASLDRDGSFRSLDLDWIGGDWNEDCRFAAVRK